MALKAPFPWFGGKSKIAPVVWERLGNTPNYVEPFFGSGAVLLARPDWHGWQNRIETVNDKDGMVCNFYRALSAEPEGVAEYADWPVNECDLSARHAWLVGQKDSLQARLEGDPDYYDAKIAGWWVWGIACWIGGEFCSGNGPWQVVDSDDGSRQLVHLGDAGRGVNRKRVQLTHHRQGVNAQQHEDLIDYFRRLAERLRRVRVCCGDWTRVCGPTPTIHQGLTAVFLDPPYSHSERDSGLYRVEKTVNDDVRAWALKWGRHPLMRIALCGYEGEGHEELQSHG